MSDSQKDTLSRWLPTIVAVVAIIGQVFYFGTRLGATEQRLVTIEQVAQSALPRNEFLSEKNSACTQFSDFKVLANSRDKEIKDMFRDINSKLDRLVERHVN